MTDRELAYEKETKMDKYAVVEAVLKVYDENARLRIENERLKQLKADIATISAPTECGSDSYAYAMARIMEAGRKVIMDKALDYWHDVRLHRNDDGSLSVEKFEEWRKDKVSKVPDYMSRDDFYKLIDVELRSEYEKKKRDAMDALAEAEREDDDE